MSSKRTARRGSERRQDARADVRLSMRVEGAPDEGDRAHIVTESQNISASGIYCYSSHYLAPLSKVALTIVLPHMPGGSGSQELVKCEGIVVRCEDVTERGRDEHFELACMFSEMDQERRFQIEEFVTWRNLQALRAAAANGGKATRGKTATSRKKTTAKAKTTSRKKAAVKRKATTARTSARRSTSTSTKKTAQAAKGAGGSTRRAGGARSTSKTARKTTARRTVH